MPQVKQDIPVCLKPFQFLGLDIEYVEGRRETITQCPFCDREGKFYVNNESGQWQCKVCGEDGNVYTFMRRVYEECRWDSEKGNELAEDRRVSPESLEAWGLRLLEDTDEWIIPGYNAEGKICVVYKRSWNYLEKRWYFQLPKGVAHGIIGLNLWDQDKDDAFLCEGLWDGTALWELLAAVKDADHTGSFLPTANPKLALLRNANVLVTPAATVFSEHWPVLFAGKRVYLCYDNDHPAKNTGVCGALEGMQRAATVMLSSSSPPKEVHYLKWGDGQSKSGAVGYDPSLKHGYDLRDLLCAAGREEGTQRRASLRRLFELFEPVPPSWIEGAKGAKGKPEILPIACDKYETVLDACKQALVMPEKMEWGLSIMLACAALVDVGGDQLWMKFIGPPSSGKTTLADGLVIARKYAVMKSITSGLHSGFKAEADDKGNTDFSLMNMIKGKAVIVKDADTLLKNEALPRILSELRDAYDRKTSTHYRNKVINEYEDHSFTMMLFGTNDIRELDQSSLGQRFIDFVMMEGIDKEFEDSVGLHKVRALKNLMANQVYLNGDRIEGKEKQRAKQLIGGYLEYLRKKMLSLISDVKMPDQYDKKVADIAKFTAIFRARPTGAKKHDEEHNREMSARLIDQLGKLAYALTVVLNKTVVDDDVMKRVIQCALDTARGNTLKIAHELYKAKAVRRSKTHKGKNEGLDMPSLSQKVNLEPRDIRKLMMFLRGINAVEIATIKTNVGMGSRMARWKLTEETKRLYQTVLG